MRSLQDQPTQKRAWNMELYAQGFKLQIPTPPK